jgi:hypothetical protein
MSSLAVHLVVQGVVRNEGNRAKQFGGVPPRRWWGTVAPAAQEVAQVTRMVVSRRGALAAAHLTMAVRALVRALAVSLVAALLVVVSATATMAIATVVPALCCSCRSLRIFVVLVHVKVVKIIFSGSLWCALLVVHHYLPF